MLYQFLRTILFQLDAEKSHHLGLTGIRLLHKTRLGSLLYPKADSEPVNVMGLNFPNRVGLAAGLDKNADYIDALASLGFGFVEVGTVTPRPQPGNPQPRLFRIPEAKAIINRMGFNNLGVDHLVEQVQAAQRSALIGINIGKNKDTAVEKAVDDYLISLKKVYAHADYVTINISSPNTPGLRKLQFGDSLKQLLDSLKSEQVRLQQRHGKYVPMAVKVSPDLISDELDELAQAFTQYEVDAVIATNTTMSRDLVKGLPNSEEAGGLSGQPVFEQSTSVVRDFRNLLPKDMPIIAAGGIMSGQDAVKKLAAGADLVQLYSGFIYHGPSLIRDCINAIERG